MTTQWYYQVMGEEVGPVSPAELRNQAQKGTVTPDTFVRRAGDENWHVAQSVSGLFDKPPAAQSPAAERPPAAAEAPRQVETRKAAQKLCERIRNAMAGIRSEIDDEELTGEQIAQMCSTLRPIVHKLEELEGSL